MASSPKRVSWDACTWIGLIQKEKIRDDKGNVVEDRYALARSVINLASRGKIEIATSGLCLAEVSKNPPDAKVGDDEVAQFFEHDYILIVAVDTQVGVIARRLMRAGYPGLKPPDAVHLATAIAANVDEMHTFDDRLLALDEKLVKNDGTALKICKPAHGGAPMPLLDAAAKAPAPPTETPTELSKAGAPKPAAPAEAIDKPKDEAEAPGPADAVSEIPAGSERAGDAGPERIRGDTEAPSPAPAQVAQDVKPTVPKPPDRSSK